ncbi:anti-sigma factor family protein [Streptomyces sp. NPDC086787]|uniref:anti-sigma factor family protein n=1 Tax=Streptomyces sp. NPDC086787 TaxID=3365759 RepID=UPI00380C0293
MSSTTDTAGHPDVSDISDLTEGLLSPSRTADVRRHLDECAPCADVRASLEEIRSMLGTLPGPVHMPADVAGRIDAALAAEARVSRETAIPDARPTDPPADRPAGRPHTATGPGRKGRAPGRRRRKVVLGAVFTAALLGAGTLFLQSLGDEESSTATTAQSTFSGSSIKSQVTDLLSAPQGEQQGHGTTKPRLGIESQTDTPGPGASANTLIQPAIPVPDCIRKGIDSNGDTLAARTGTYDGKSAYLVLMSVVGDSTHVTAYIVDTSCVGRQPAATGKVLLKQSFTRP